MQRFSLLDAAALVRETITQAPGQEMYERFRQLRCTGLRDVGWPEMSDLSTLRRSTAAENSASLRNFRQLVQRNELTNKGALRTRSMRATSEAVGLHLVGERSAVDVKLPCRLRLIPARVAQRVLDQRPLERVDTASSETGKMLSSVNDAVLAALPGALLDLELLLL